MLTRSLPSTPLRDFVGHYWLSLDNRDPTYATLPDGAVDLVIEVRGIPASDGFMAPRQPEPR